MLRLQEMTMDPHMHAECCNSTVISNHDIRVVESHN